MHNQYRLNLDALTKAEDLATACNMTPDAAQHTLRYMLDVPWYGGYSGGRDKSIDSIAASEAVLKHTSFLSVIEEVLSWKSTGLPSGDSPNQATVSPTESPPVSERLATALPDWLTKLLDTAQVLMREVHLAMGAELYALSATQLSLLEGKGDLLLGEFALLHDMLLPIQGVHHAGSLCNRTVRNPGTGSTLR